MPPTRQPGHDADWCSWDPPYGQGLISKALGALQTAGWVASDALIVTETGRDEALPLPGTPLASRAHGAASINVWRSVPGLTG